MEQIGNLLDEVLRDAKVVFIYCEPSINDFTRLFESFLIILNKEKSLRIKLSEDLNDLGSLFLLYLFNGELNVVSWDIKKLITYLKFHIHPEIFKSFNFSKVLDLRVSESFLGIKLNCPSLWSEALKRMKLCRESPFWHKIHSSIHLPLSVKVLPFLETVGVLEEKKKEVYYPFYEIEGQIHGRLSSLLAFDNCINSHSLSIEQKSAFLPIPPHNFFIYFDFRHMEVSMLQWLSGDKKLGEIIEGKDDVYKKIYDLVIVGEESDEEKRQKCKNFFLPVIYGMQANSLSEKIGISKEDANGLISRISECFSMAWQWIMSEQEKANGRVVDFFGRVRELEEKSYLARHFVVAAPSAIVCLEKLIELFDSLQKAKLIFSVHDGFYLTTYKENLKEVILNSKKILESESKLCPGLKLKVSCQVGKKMNEMKKIF